jgi:NFU1 iron-sulfur cluster scaffold homolog, mitochondrial
VTDPAVAVTAALERSVLPTVIARGAVLRVAGVRDGVVTLEVTGSPGAVYPLAERIETMIRAAAPGITAVRLATPGPEPAEAAKPAGTAEPAEAAEPAGDLAAAARRILEGEVNPAIAAHRGHVTVDGAADGWIRIRLEGGCQGCSLAEVTVRQGIEPLLRARLPAMTGLADVTDHQAGPDPFFSPEKR